MTDCDVCIYFVKFNDFIGCNELGELKRKKRKCRKVIRKNDSTIGRRP